MYHFHLVDPHFLPHSGCAIEFSLKSGELMTIVGENGLGKSTLARRFWEARRVSMTLVEQKALDVFYDRPLGKIKELLLHSRSHELSHDFFLSLWSRFGLAQKEDRFQSTLSGGEAQALKLCLGLTQKTEIYVLDEPSQFLDHSMKAKLNEVIAELLKENKMVLMIEHDYEWVKLPNQVLELGIRSGTLEKVKSWST